MLADFFQRWRQSSQDRTGLDVLLAQVPAPASPLQDRLGWLARMVHWVRSPGLNLAVFTHQQAGRLQLARLRYVQQIFDKNPVFRKSASATLSSIIRDTSALELFMSVGIPGQQGFIGECVERMHLRWLPPAPQDKDLVTVFAQTFRFKGDPHWIRSMDLELFQSWMDLFRDTTLGPTGADKASNAQRDSLLEDARDAALLLSQMISSMGVSRWVRERAKAEHFRKLPFFELPERVQILLDAQDRSAREAAYVQVKQTLERSMSTIDEVYEHFRRKGVSIALVYQIERLKVLVHRLRTVCRLLAGYEREPRLIRDFLALLIEQNYRARSLRGLVSDNIVLVCQKIVETNAETGEHYISRDANEHVKIIKSAAGGGVVTAFTTLGKVMLHHLDIAPFVWGILASVNYAASFIVLQILGLTLATKQPAMTATVLASKLDSTTEESEPGIKPLVDEIVHMIRSQIATVAGNLGTVIPSVFLLTFISMRMGHPIVDKEYARKLLESFSLWGPTPLLAVWTGVLLWASSVFSGLFANWFSFRRLPEAIENHPRLIYVVGAARARRLAEYLRRNAAGFAANTSLGFLLGMSLPVGSFFGIPLDVRHVTLSSGMMTAACAALGSEIYSQPVFWWAIAGVISMAIFNLAVSFTLALIVAIWAKKASAPSRSVIYRALLRKLLSEPWLLFCRHASPHSDSLR